MLRSFKTNNADEDESDQSLFLSQKDPAISACKKIDGIEGVKKEKGIVTPEKPFSEVEVVEGDLPEHLPASVEPNLQASVSSPPPLLPSSTPPPELQAPEVTRTEHILSMKPPVIVPDLKTYEAHERVESRLTRARQTRDGDSFKLRSAPSPGSIHSMHNGSNIARFVWGHLILGDGEDQILRVQVQEFKPEIQIFLINTKLPGTDIIPFEAKYLCTVSDFISFYLEVRQPFT